MRSAALLAAMLWFSTCVAARAQDQDLLVNIESTGDVKAVYVTATTGDSLGELSLTADNPATLKVMTDTGYDLPARLTVEWDDDSSTTIPAYVFAPYAGKRISLRIYRFNFTANDVEKADKLCFHTAVADSRSAFRALFGCQEWIHLLDARKERWTRTYLRGLRGWFNGAYYLATNIKPIRGLRLSPWGLQPELVKLLREILQAVEDKQKPRSFFEPTLDLGEIRTALDTLDRWELKLYGLIPTLVSDGALSDAKELNDIVYDAYRRLKGVDATAAVDGVNRAGLDANAALIQTKLALTASR